jgi:hypothetical protein
MAGIAHDVHASMPFKLRLLRLVFARQLREFLRLQSYYEERMSPDLFQTHLKYLVLVFRDGE